MRKTVWIFSSQGFIEVTGGRIWFGVVDEAGNNASSKNAPLLVIHGGPGMTHDYLYPLTDIANERPVIFYDQLDAGLSDRPNDPGNWTISRFVSEIEAIRDALNVTELSLFGNSWGGTVAAAYAATQPVGLERLILSSPLINTRRWIADNKAYRSALPDDVLVTMDRCEANGEINSPQYQNAVDIFYKRHLCRMDTWPDYVMNTFESLNVTCYTGMWGPNEFTCNGILENYDGSEELAEIKVPTLVTCGEFDEATPVSCSKYSDMIPKSETAVFENASHLTFVEARKNYIVKIRKFLSA